MGERGSGHVVDTHNVGSFSLITASALRGVSRGVFLPVSWSFYRLYVSNEANTLWYGISLSLFLALEHISMILTHHCVDLLHFQRMSVILGLLGLTGAAGYAILPFQLTTHWAEIVWLCGGCLVALWFGAGEMLEISYVSEACRLKQRLKASRRLNLTRDFGVFIGLITGLIVMIGGESSGKYVFVVIGGVMSLSPLLYLAVILVGFEGVSVYLRLSLSRQLDLSSTINLLDLPTLTELSTRDREFSFLHDSFIEPPRTCGLLLSASTYAVFQFSRTIICISFPRLTTLDNNELYMTFMLGTGLGVLLLTGNHLLMRPTYDRTICGLLLALSAGGWILSELNEYVFVVVTIGLNLVAVQAAENVFTLVAGPRELHRELLIAAGVLGVIPGAVWASHDLSLLGYLPAAGLNVLMLVLVLSLWTECLPHVEFLKKAKYFYIKELKYPEEVRQEAAYRLRHDVFKS